MKKRYRKLLVFLLIIIGILTIDCGCTKKEKKEDNNSANTKESAEKSEKDETKIGIEIDRMEGFNEGYAPVRNKETQLWGLIDTNGNLVFDFKYKKLANVNDGMVMFSYGSSIGFMNLKEEIIVPAEYDYSFKYTDGYLFLRVNGGNGIIVNKKGETVAKIPNVTYAGYVSEGLISVVNQKDNSKGFYDLTGKKVIDYQYSYTNGFSEGLADVVKNDKLGFIDKTGKTVIPFIYEFESESGFHDGYSIVKFNRKYGVIDKKGNKIIDFVYDKLRKYSDGLFAAQKDQKWGYIDINGNVIIDFQFDSAYDFSEGLARVQKNGKETFIDKTGKTITDYKFDIFHGADVDYLFHNGYALVIINKNEKFIDKNGKIVFEKIYTDKKEDK